MGVLYTQVHAGVSQANILYSEQACIIIIYNYYVFNLIRFSIIVIVRYSCSTFKIIIAITDMFFQQDHNNYTCTGNISFCLVQNTKDNH